MIFSEFLEKQAAGAMSRIKSLDVVADNITNVINRLSPTQYSDLPAFKSMRFADLSTGVKGRLQAAAIRSGTTPTDWLRLAKRRPWYRGSNSGGWFDEYKNELFNSYYDGSFVPEKISGYDRRYTFLDLYKKYLERASAQDPKFSRIVDRTKQLKSRRDSLEQAKTDDGGLYNELKDRVYQRMQKSTLGDHRDIPTLTVYEANTTFPTTHHLASAELSSRANRLAAEADDSAEFIPSVPGTGFMGNRNPFHKIHRPGQERTWDDVIAARENKLIGSSNEYEAAFDKLNAPHVKAIYSRLTPDAQSFLGVTDDQIVHYAPDLQSLSRMALYKGRRDGSTMPFTSKLSLLARKATDSLRDIMHARYAKQLVHRSSGDPAATGLRWYTPWAHMGSGYAVGEDAALSAPWVKLNTEQVAKLRNLYKQDVENTHAAADDVASVFKDTIINSPNRQDLINNTRIDYLSGKINEQLAKLVREGKIPHTLYKTIMGLD